MVLVRVAILGSSLSLVVLVLVERSLVLVLVERSLVLVLDGQITNWRVERNKVGLEGGACVCIYIYIFMCALCMYIYICV